MGWRASFIRGAAAGLFASVAQNEDGKTEKSMIPSFFDDNPLISLETAKL